MSASAEQLISYIYDAILNGCRTQNQEKVLSGLTELIKALNFDQKEIAVPMYQLYQFCLERARKKEYEIVEEIIGEFKAAWSEAMNVS
ncbi:MAG: flagellar protein FliS [Candidatus Marinimicrobia bacterium]|nr:flagellar protein FliS [Candidatus Neomarinimicrobiota bacterium]